MIIREFYHILVKHALSKSFFRKPTFFFSDVVLNEKEIIEAFEMFRLSKESERKEILSLEHKAKHRTDTEIFTVFDNVTTINEKDETEIAELE